MMDNLELVDEYDQDDPLNEVEFWDTEDPEDNSVPDTIMSCYSGDIYLRENQVFLMPPKSSDEDPDQIRINY